MSVKGKLLGWSVRLESSAIALWQRQNELVDQRIWLQMTHADDADIADAQCEIDEVGDAAIYVQEYASFLYRRAQRPEYWQEYWRELAGCSCTLRDDAACASCIPSGDLEFDELPF